MHGINNRMVIPGRKDALSISEREFEALIMRKFDWPAQVLFADDNCDNAYNMFTHFAGKAVRAQAEAGTKIEPEPLYTTRRQRGYPRIDSCWFKPFFSEVVEQIPTYHFAKMADTQLKLESQE